MCFCSLYFSFFFFSTCTCTSLLFLSWHESSINNSYGKPGVEYYADLDYDSPVRQIQFVPGKRGQLILLHDDGLIQLYELNYKEDNNEISLDKVRSSEHFLRNESNGSQLATTVSIVLSKDSSVNVYVGTQGGNIYALDLDTFELSNSIIYQDVVLQSVPAEQKKSNQGSVEVITPQPNAFGKLLIGYQRGILVLWDVENSSCERFYNSSQVSCCFSFYLYHHKVYTLLLLLYNIFFLLV